MRGIGGYQHFQARNIPIKSFVTQRKGWRTERRAELVEFRVPKSLKLTYNKRTTDADWLGKNAKMEFHEFKSGKIMIAFVINHNVELEKLERGTCGNDSTQYTLIGAHKISTPRSGSFRESRVADQHSMMLLLQGGKNSYVFYISWPFHQEKRKRMAGQISRDDFKEILESLSFVSARTDAGG